MAVLYRNQVALLFFACISCSVFALVKPSSKQSRASWHSLPADVKRYIFPFIASSNVYEVAETMKMLNATDRFCNGALHSDSVVKSILERMPYTYNRMCLLEDHFKKWYMKKDFFDHYLHWDDLRNGGELINAVKQNNQKIMAQLLSQENIKLDCWQDAEGNALAIAIQTKNEVVATALIKAGARVKMFSTLHNAVLRRSSAALIKLLLEYGGDPNTITQYELSHHEVTPEVRKIITEAKKLRKQRLFLLHGKKVDWWKGS